MAASVTVSPQGTVALEDAVPFARTLPPTAVLTAPLLSSVWTLLLTVHCLRVNVAVTSTVVAPVPVVTVQVWGAGVPPQPDADQPVKL